MGTRADVISVTPAREAACTVTSASDVNSADALVPAAKTAAVGVA